MNTECMTFDDVGSVTKYVYSAAGQKLRVVHYTAKPNISRTWGVKPAVIRRTDPVILESDANANKMQTTFASILRWFY